LLPGFPFDFAQGGEPVEPRVSLTGILLARNDAFVEWRLSLSGGAQSGIVRHQDSISEKRVNLFHEDGFKHLSVIDKFL
jgi:hypothetical protein